MAQLSELVTGSIARIENTDGGYFEMLVLQNNSSGTWLLDIAGQETYPWDSRQSGCNKLKNKLTQSVKSKVAECRLLKREEITGGSPLIYFGSGRTLSSYISSTNWWTDTEYNTASAYCINKYNTVTSAKSNSLEIHPVLILNGSGDVSGITLPPKEIFIPTLSPTSYTYDGKPHEPTVNYNGNESYINTAKNYSVEPEKPSAVGTYTITCSLKDTSKYNWSNNLNGKTANVVLNWEIKAPAATPITVVPTPNTTLTYNGGEQTMTFNNYDSTKMNVSGNTGTNAGSYTATFTLKTGYCWSGGSTAAKSVSWSIGRKEIPEPTQNGTLEYTGSSQSPKWNNYNAADGKLTIGGATSGTNVGSYTATFTPASNYCWSGGGTSRKSVTWVIENQKINEKPGQKGGLIYNGSSQSPEWDYYYPEKMTMYGVTSGTDAGTYTATFTPKSGYSWADGSTGIYKADWTISRFVLKPPKQTGELFYNKKEQSPTWDTDYTVLDIPDAKGIDANTYYVTFYCGKNFRFSPCDEGNDRQITVSWEIKSSPTAVPPVMDKGEFEYDGDEHSPTWKKDKDNEEKIIFDGDTSGTNAYNYEIFVFPAPNYSWENGSTNGISYYWEITRKTLLKDPDLKTYVIEYNGEEQTPGTVNYPQDFVEGSGLTGTDAGDYTAEFTIDSNHCWTDRTFLPIRIPWAIARMKIPVPSQNGKLVYNGHTQSPDWKDYDEVRLDISGDIDGVHADTYIAVFTPTANYQWIDGGYDSRPVNWEIDKYHFQYPFQAENRDPINPRLYYSGISEFLQYNGAEQSPTLWFGNIYNNNLTTIALENAFSVKGVSSAVNVGEYTMRLTPDGDHCWADGNSNTYDVVWRIVKRVLPVPFQIGELYYTGETLYPEFSGYDPAILEMGGAVCGIDIGDYIAYFDIKDKENNEWSGHRGSGQVGATWRISETPVLIPRPYQDNYLVYNGEFQSPTWANYDKNTMLLIGGMPRKKDAGTYEVRFKPKGVYRWEDGSTDEITVEWAIHKCKIKMPSVHGTDADGNGGQYTEINGKRYPVWDNFDRNFADISGDEYAIDGGQYRTVFTLKDPYNYAWANGNSEPLEVLWSLGNPYVPGSGGGTDSDDTVIVEDIRPGNPPVIGDEEEPPDNVVSVILPGGVPPADEDSIVPVIPPENIAIAINGGIYDEIWKIGDMFPIKLDGEVGGVRFKDAWLYAYIIGFDHNSGIEGKKTIHFQFAKLSVNRKEIAFTDKYYGRVDGGHGFCMNQTDTAKGGWRDSYMRNTLCRQFYEALPQEWRDIIISCPKYTDNVGDGSDAESAVTMTRDKIFLLSEYECIGRNVSSNSAEDKYQQQYEYYKENGYKGKIKYSAWDEEAECWLRSPCRDTNDQFCISSYSDYNPSGGCNGEFAADSYGFAPCFAVGEIGSDGAGGDFYPDDDPNKPTENYDGFTRVHIPRQIDPPYEDGSAKTPEWDEYDDIAIINLGGEWSGVSADTYYVVLELKPGYVWEDGTVEIKTVPWVILAVGEPKPGGLPPILVHIPQQIDPPYFDRYPKTPEWDEWNRFAINIIGGDTSGVFAGDYYRMIVELNPGYVWEDNTTENKRLPWEILPIGASLPDGGRDKFEIIDDKLPDRDTAFYPNDEVEGDITEDGTNDDNRCCNPCCDTGLFDKLDNACPDDGFECDCSGEVKI